ncbi:hypothetical protein MLD38_002136 [Melastoma candidum]|uniref:Uncharacterized protein n=1 Tax=Melastoma candidum TaxID=119954 RepID=A0ACB9SP31_9MYRT|nr:hypothetical protein MLD38_002136 [Melastoma candidum]
MAPSSSSFLSLSSLAAAGTGAGRCPGAAWFLSHRVATSASCATIAESPPRALGSQGDPIASTSSLYDVLGIRIGATSQEIKSAYRGLARVLHPDAASSRCGDGTGQEFMIVHEAYATLSDPVKRADYDRALTLVGPRARRSQVCAGSGSGLRTRKWETDQCW